MAGNETYHVHKPSDGLCGYCGERKPEDCIFVYCPKCPPGCGKKLRPEPVR